MIWFKETGSKYRNARQTYNDYSYMSRKEAQYAYELDLRLKAKDIKSWRRQQKIDLTFNGFYICNYFIDFVIIHNDGTEEYVEVKGMETPEWKLKWKMTEAMLYKKIAKGKIKLTLVK